MRTTRARWAIAIVLALAAAPAATEEPPWTFELGVPYRGRIGVQVLPMTPELRQHLEAPDDRGLLVSRVEPSRAGAEAGVRVGDVVTDVDGEPMRSPFDLVKAVGRAPAGSTLRLGIVRDGRARTLAVEPEGDANEWVDPQQWDELFRRGMRRGTKELRRHLEDLQRRLDELERDGPQQTT